MHLYVNNFSIRVFEQHQGASPFSLEDNNDVLLIKSDTSLFNRNASVILADPFLFVKGETLYLFYEHLTRWFGIGRICMRSTKDLKNWTEEVDVLIEPYHLSFPYVFEDCGRIYMLPETGEDHSIRLYEAEDDTLTKWRFVKKLREDVEPWYDSVIYKKDGKYYLFSGTDDNVQQVEHLFVADSLTGPYFEHPNSPIYTGRDGGRNAGSIINHEGKIYRPVQVCVSGYGEQTSMMEIELLTPAKYKERLFKKNIIDTSKAPYKLGGHQWNQVEFLGKLVVATDYRERNYNIIETLRKAKHLFFK